MPERGLRTKMQGTPVYGLSCVENQLLFFLRERGWDIARLYANAAIPLQELFTLFVRRGERYERFERIPRIQTLLKEEGLLSLTRHTADSRRAADEARAAGPDRAVLVMVTPDFARRALHARGLRDDHYVRLTAEGDGCRLRNDLPETEVLLSPQELDAAYGGNYLLAAVQRENTPQDDRRRWENRLFPAEALEPFSVGPEDFDSAVLSDVPELARRLRDLAGIYKLTRYQMQAYYAPAADTAFMRELLERAEKRYAQWGYYHLKKETDPAPLIALFEALNEDETALIRRLQASWRPSRCGGVVPIQNEGGNGNGIHTHGGQ